MDANTFKETRLGEQVWEVGTTEVARLTAEVATDSPRKHARAVSSAWPALLQCRLRPSNSTNMAIIISSSPLHVLQLALLICDPEHLHGKPLKAQPQKNGAVG